MKYYNFHSDGKSKVICTAEFAGKKFRGVAKCSPNDTFDLEKGKAIAFARCQLKFAAYKRDLMIKQKDEMAENLARAIVNYNKSKSRVDAAISEFIQAYCAKQEIERKV